MTDIYIDMHAEISTIMYGYVNTIHISARIVKDSENHLFDLSMAKFAIWDISK